MGKDHNCISSNLHVSAVCELSSCLQKLSVRLWSFFFGGILLVVCINSFWKTSFLQMRIPGKATKFWPIFHFLFDITYIIASNYKWKMGQIFVAYSEYTLYNAILRIARNFLETRENIEISTNPFYHINLG